MTLTRWIDLPLAGCGSGRSRQPDFVVRAKTGPAEGLDDARLCLGRESGEGFSMKLNAMPIGTGGAAC